MNRDPFEDNILVSNAYASKMLGVEVEYQPIQYDAKTVEELHSLLMTEARIRARLRVLTGETVHADAIQAARTIVQAAKTAEASHHYLPETITPQTVDDRYRSSSIRTVSGGLPSFGRR